MVWDILVIGGGIAGLTAAVYAARAGKRVLVLEQSVFGGQIANTPRVENYPGYESVSGSAFSEALQKQAVHLQAELRREKVRAVKDIGAVKQVCTDKAQYDCRALILAVGVRHRHLGLETEEKYTGRGVSYCALCDGAFFKNKKTAVVGGGNTAVQNTLYLADTAAEVYLIHRRDSFRAQQTLVDRLAEKANVKLYLNKTVTELSGAPVLQTVTLKNTQNGAVELLDTDGLFVSVGQIPENGIFTDIADLDADGFLKAGEDCRTKTAGVFAAGDCRAKSVRQLTTAASDGSVAAIAACAYLAM